MGTKKKGSKTWIDGINRGGYDSVDIPFPAYLTSAINSLGENISYDYVCGTSGAAFRLIWDPEKWNPGNSDISYMSENPIEPFQRAFEAIGYGFMLVSKKKEEMNPEYSNNLQSCAKKILEKDEFEKEMLDSISNRGIPVLAFGVIGPPECCLITGYDDGGNSLLGWNFFQDIPFFHDTPHDELGYFRKENWYNETPYYILIGEKHNQRPIQEIYVNSLKNALRIARTVKVRGKYSGLAAYDAWAEALTDEDDFRDLSDEDIGLRVMVHNDIHGCLYFGRRQAVSFLKRIGDEIPEISSELLDATECFEEEVKTMAWNESGRFVHSEARSEFADLILKAKDKESQAITFIEKALENTG
jgi:hypothetical protein